MSCASNRTVFPPSILLRPTEDLEINGDETLSLEYSARDDFGIGEIALITKVGDREDKISLQKEDAKRLILRDQYAWDLGKLGLRDGEEAVFFLQVFDNDTISGPKIGTSRSIRLKLKNLKGEHQQVADMVRDLNQRMVDLLADHLETPAPGEKPAAPELDKKFEQNLTDALKRTEDVMRQTEKDRMSDFATWTDLEALKRNLEFTKNELLKKQEQAANDRRKAQGARRYRCRARAHVASVRRHRQADEGPGAGLDGARLGAQPGAADGRLGEAPERRQESRRDHEADRRAGENLGEPAAGGLAARAADAGRFYERRHHARSRLQ